MQRRNATAANPESMAAQCGVTRGKAASLERGAEPAALTQQQWAASMQKRPARRAVGSDGQVLCCRSSAGAARNMPRLLKRMACSAARVPSWSYTGQGTQPMAWTGVARSSGMGRCAQQGRAEPAC